MDRMDGIRQTMNAEAMRGELKDKLISAHRSSLRHFLHPVHPVHRC
jgi:hypothetical protein